MVGILPGEVGVGAGMLQSPFAWQLPEFPGKWGLPE